MERQNKKLNNIKKQEEKRDWAQDKKRVPLAGIFKRKTQEKRQYKMLESIKNER